MRVITLHPTDFNTACKQLFSQIEFQPDLVIAIKNGGTFVLNKYLQESENQIPFHEIELQRPSTKKLKKSWVKFIFKLLPYSILNKIRVYEHRQLLKNKLSANYFDFKLNIKSNNASNILVVDDALDSGQTMSVVIKALQVKFPKAIIKSAVIAWTNSASVVQPNYYVYKGILVRFPWSMDYKSFANG